VSRPFPGLDVPVSTIQTGLMTQTWYEYFQSRTIGQYIEGVVLSGSAVALVSGTAKTINSILLPAGDWDVDALTYFLPAATTSVTRYVASISATTDTFDLTPGRFTDITIPATVSGGNAFTSSIPSYRIRQFSTSTLFLVAQATFTISTMSAYSILRARRLD
jgi:hypothetical protein